jgi:hypothetical protein
VIDLDVDRMRSNHWAGSTSPLVPTRRMAWPNTVNLVGLGGTHAQNAPGVRVSAACDQI